ncbi:MAG: lipid-A-disaccharide synthase [Fibrobacter sp.]|nr:lipid-A-disaccharide synthase [Fibrobacter sp.]
MQEPFVLFCAGEDSGDVLGEAFVQSIVQRGMLPVGTGGSRMQNAGLVPVAEFNELPVSGFLDVLPRTAKLQKVYRKLKDLLCSEECKAFIAIDYPGFNMKLCQVAKKMGKPVLYVAPPQIWAWKPGRAQKLDGVNLAVLFQFEKEAYAQKGVNADVLLHPFLLHENLYHTLPYSEQLNSSEETLLLFPGSRLSQAKRNMDLFLKVAEAWLKMPSPQVATGKRVKLIVPRESLIPSLESYIQKIGEAERQQFSVQVAPEDSEERRMLFGAASMALATPGTVTLELALSGAPLVVATKPDFLTYALGKLLVKTRTFAMPNILMGNSLIPEFIGRGTKKMVPQILAAMHNQDIAKSRPLAVSLTECLGKGFVPDYFVDKLFNG